MGGTGPLSGAGAAALAWRVLLWVVLIGLLLEAGYRAYDIRLWAIKDYGPIIHEFDPWFNYRATEYLAQHGWNKFFTWFDHQSWYPLGRPVATTIYPGMQITAVFLWQILQRWDSSWDLNQVCCYMPAWFGAATSLFTGLLTFDALAGRDAGPMPSGAAVLGAAAAARCMAIVPAHLSRSVGGGFDNEAVAIGPMVATFAFWCRALRPGLSWPWSFCAAVSYSFMAASWGGYIFALNMVGLHAGLLVFLGSAGNLYAAYSLFFVVGTLGAIQARPVSVLVWFRSGFERPRLRTGAITFSSRGGLCFTAPVGFLIVLLRVLLRPWRADADWFMLALGAVSYFFARKMKRWGCAVAFLADVALASAEFRLGRSEHRRGAWLDQPVPRLLRLAAVMGTCYLLKPQVEEFLHFCDHKARWSLSHPQIVTKAKDGTLIDDYRQAYGWLRQNTASDARIMAWWDYGYQIAGLANRTTLADGNTWNHEHIALLGLALSSPQGEAHKIARHLADYVLVWSGGGGKDDVGKSKHMARIANSVYRGHCNEDDCDQYGIFPDGQPSKMMEASLVYRLCGRGSLDERLFREVYVSHHRRVRVAQVLDVSASSRRWAASAEAKRCDAPGSWYCPGSYSPGLQELFDPNATHQEALDYQAAYATRVQEQLKEKPLPNQEGLPPGSYLDSCRGCLISGTRLTCSHCRAPGSPSIASNLEYQKCPLPQINNIQGRLQCEPKPNAASIPRGGYQRSCKGCDMQGDVLHCSHCGTASGNQVPASFEVLRCPAPAELDNDNGRLTCRGVPNDLACPPGPYLKSCQGCRSEAGHVSCALCRRADGRQVAAEAAAGRCRWPAQLENQDGELVCSGSLAGPYKQSCSKCQQLDDVLSCECAKSDGQRLVSSYEVSRCQSPAELHNREGKLTCQGVPNGRRLPPGPYLESCEGCHVFKETLHCSHCLNAEGLQLKSSLEVAACLSQQRKPENVNGAPSTGGRWPVSARGHYTSTLGHGHTVRGHSGLAAMLQALAALDDATLLTVITETLQRRPELAPGVVNGAVPDLTYAPADSLTKRRATGRIKQVTGATGVGFIDCPELKAVFGHDVYVHKNQVGAFPIGTEVNFAILLSKDMKPQAFDLQPTGAARGAAVQRVGGPDHGCFAIHALFGVTASPMEIPGERALVADGYWCATLGPLLILKPPILEKHLWPIPSQALRSLDVNTGPLGVLTTLWGTLLLHEPLKARLGHERVLKGVCGINVAASCGLAALTFLAPSRLLLAGLAAQVAGFAAWQATSFAE
ncbi:unnamed protein product [Durusdinium trenchii]|uniref:dolichyl-diphosphooligosaccharide--protein glycotransferase n=1 Tax=Durusdinium trenchii TaxID=1381693 RepID=A0ABP0QG95_9DINO